MKTLLSLIFGALIGVSLTACERNRAEEAQLICTTNESWLHRQDGWRQLNEADRLKISRTGMNKNVEVEYRPGTLSCAYWLGSQMVTRLPNAGMMYWRVKQ